MKIREFGPAEGPLMARGLAAGSEFQICLSACLFHSPYWSYMVIYYIISYFTMFIYFLFRGHMNAQLTRLLPRGMKHSRHHQV